MDYTLVLGIDQKTIECLRLVWPTWVKNKPTMTKQPLLVFYNDVSEQNITDVIGNNSQTSLVRWPPPNVMYPRDNLTKWTNSQRAKMLAGFVHCAGKYVETPYWLKLDVDVVATGMDDWVDDAWFAETPAIIAPGWGYTKPPYQMLQLDKWAETKQPMPLAACSPLNLLPEKGASAVYHERVCSWCAFFETEFSARISLWAESTCGVGQLPVDSQDGFSWYCAKRLGLPIQVVKMKRFGWQLKNGLDAIREASQTVMAS